MSDPLQLPKVLTYHAKIHITKDNLTHTLAVDWPDWAKEREILVALAKKYNVRKVGEVVEAYLREHPTEVLAPYAGQRPVELFPWDEVLV